jgi:Putative glucoamylase/Protein of unknown function (DUF3131)
MSRALLALAASLGMAMAITLGGTVSAASPRPSHELSHDQLQQLQAIARDTWRFFDADTDPATHLPLDNIGLNGAPARGAYTSPTNIGVYFWSVVAAHDMGVIDRRAELDRVTATLAEVERLSKWNGFLFSWYSTTNGHHIDSPGGPDLEGQPAKGQLISTVDNGWYASGLILVRQEFPELAQRATALLNAMDFSFFYDAGVPSNPQITDGQMFGGYIADTGPANFHYGLLNTETRIAAYIGIGTHRMPGNVWWRTWRTLPASFDWQAQVPQGATVTYRDPQSGKPFDVFEGHYSYGGMSFVPSWGGSMFESLMPALVVPENEWGPRSFGLNDVVYAKAQIAYAQQALHFPFWGLSPSSTPDDTGGYLAYGAHGLASNSGPGCGGCAYAETAVTPHASFLALDVAPDQAFANIQRLRAVPGLYGPYGFFDAVDPRTNAVGHRYLVLDQSMIMAALDNVLADGAMHDHFARDPIIQAARPYLAMEQFSLGER